MNRVVRQTGLDIEIAQDYESLSRRAADLIIQELRQQPNLLLCASAGGTPTRTYELLGQHALRRPALFQKIRVLQIDEWLGLPRRHQASCGLDLHRKLIQPLNITPSRNIGFRGDTADPKNECRRIAAWLARHGPVDICILGLGANGHVAMNEPADSLVPGVHLARLAKSSLHHALLASLPHKPRRRRHFALAQNTAPGQWPTQTRRGPNIVAPEGHHSLSRFAPPAAS
jgi:galactosamine-6-phosphate isomerase